MPGDCAAPGTAPEDTLIGAVEENAAGMLLSMGRTGGGEESIDPRLAFTLGGSPLGYHNAVVHAELPDGEADAAIVWFRDKLRALNLPGCWHVDATSTPRDLPERLRRHGFTGGGEPVMACPLDALPEVAAPDGLSVERVRGEAELRALADVLAAGFGEGEVEARWAESVWAKIGFADDTPWRHYLARLEGRPVGCASLFVHPCDVGGIYFVCTHPDYRRRGIGAAVTMAAMRGARDLGCRLAVLGTSDQGRPVYERLGFRLVGSVLIFDWTP
jgi:GNAT superfamily N-acetyltransferase